MSAIQVVLLLLNLPIALLPVTSARADTARFEVTTGSHPHDVAPAPGGGRVNLGSSIRPRATSIGYRWVRRRHHTA